MDGKGAFWAGVEGNGDGKASVRTSCFWGVDLVASLFSSVIGVGC